MIRFICALVLISGISSYIPNLNTKKYVRKFENMNDITVFEPINFDKKEASCVVFFTGGNSLMPADIYSDFLEKIASKNLAVYVPRLNYYNFDKLINKLKKEYKDVNFIGHSSGGITAIKKSIKNKSVRNLILLDSVDSRLLDNKFRNKKYILRNLKNLVFLNAAKSYKLNLDPFGFPFIPFMSLNKEAFELSKNCNIKQIYATYYGHADVLNSPFANFMHNSRIAVGYKDRKLGILDKYYNWIAKIIYLTCKNRLNEKNNYNDLEYN